MIGYKLSKCPDIPAFWLEDTRIDDCCHCVYFYARRNGCPDKDVPIGHWVNSAHGFPRLQETSELEFLVLTGTTLELSWEKSLENDRSHSTKIT